MTFKGRETGPKIAINFFFSGGVDKKLQLIIFLSGSMIHQFKIPFRHTLILPPIGEEGRSGEYQVVLYFLTEDELHYGLLLYYGLSLYYGLLLHYG